MDVSYVDLYFISVMCGCFICRSIFPICYVWLFHMLIYISYLLCVYVSYVDLDFLLCVDVSCVDLYFLFVVCGCFICRSRFHICYVWMFHV